MTQARTKDCEQCGRSFPRPPQASAREWAERKFCNRDCYQANRAGQRRVCAAPGCGQQVNRYDATYCSLSCAGKVTAAAAHARGERRPPPQVPRMPRPACSREGCTNQVPRPKSKFCSPECVYADRTAECQRGHEKPPGPCAECKRIGDRERKAAKKAAERAAGGPVPARAAASVPAPPPTPATEAVLVWKPQISGGPIVRYPDGSERPAQRKEVDRWRVLV